MSVPDKIYFRKYHLAQLVDFGGIDSPHEDGNHIEYTRTPKAKKFADEKPEECELIMYRVSKGSLWQQMYWREIFYLPEIQDFEWFPVTLPTIEE